MATDRPALIPTILRWFLLGMILANIAGEMFYALLPIYLAELGASVGQIGLIFSAASLWMLGLQLAGGWLSDTIGRLRAVAICLEFISTALVTPSFGAFIAPWLGAQLWTRFHPRLPFALTALAALATVSLVWVKFKSPVKTGTLFGENLIDTNRS